MTILDTHAWVWWINGDERLSPQALQTINAEPELGISAISCWEVAMLVAKGRLELEVPLETWVEDALSLPGFQLLPLTPAVALLAGGTALDLHGDPADRIIAATAIERDATLITADERLRTNARLRTAW